MDIIKGTTPTFVYTFTAVTVSDISEAFFTVKQGGSVIITKDITDAVVGTKTLSFELSQTETLKLEFPECKTMLNWKLSDGTRGASSEQTIHVRENQINEVI